MYVRLSFIYIIINVFMYIYIHVGNDAIVALASAYNNGELDFLVTLDMSDVGANSDTMILLGRQILSR